MGMISEFKEFIAKGNVIDLAVGVVIGAAFGKIVTALVDGIVMPLVGVALGGVSVTDWKYVLKPETVDAAGQEDRGGRGALRCFHPDADRLPGDRAGDLPGAQGLQPPAQAAMLSPAPAEEVLLLREIRDSLRR